MPTYLEKFDRACETNRSLVCVGLDPEPSRLPMDDVLDFNRAIIEATADLAAAYKPNLSFYEALGIPGLQALEGTIQAIREAAPSALIIGDAKRGDIGPSGQAYARAMFQVWGFDSVTINAWGGADTVEPFIEDPDRGIFIWCRGSNPGSATLQDLELKTSGGGGVPVYEHLARTSLEWNGKGNVGLVVGATAPEQLDSVRGICPDAPLLIPGVGSQGGDLQNAVRYGANADGRRAVINSSRGIIYASTGADFAQAARQATAALRDAINETLEAEGKGWPSK